MINWSTDKEEHLLIDKIAKRANAMASELGFEYRIMTIHMDINACHSNGNPLNLVALAEADDADFAHDVFGIRRYIDRETGKLGDCFVPRYSV